MGSIAFGALVIALVQLFQVILQYIQKKLKTHNNPVTFFILKCLRCCFWCLEKFVKFLSKNAYIMLCIFGKNFCMSAKSAFNLLMRNVVSVAVIDRVTDVLLLISKLFVIGLLGLMSFAVFGDASMRLVPSGRLYDFLDKVKPELHFYWVPIVIVVLGTLVITTGFFNVYSMGVDTIFLSFLEDLERHDGSAEKPYYMNSKLRRLMNKKNRR
ncbi:hypothetical protein NP493_1012g00065 [Ridgeia piscesae]|uniref:Choline transporter-like protein n=1 Tax=Ridgeia piscesae TaxID=27915 RepID=A0AAD9KIV9_RIDPI|nr:hypothetical protein NP493_1012g00065 [Ridgeia piscesae]